MTFDTQPRPKFAALVAACLLSVALPSGAVLAKEKNKTPAPPITVSAPEFSVDIATIDAVGSNVDEATLRAIFSGNIVDNADALASLTADSITIPAITISFSGEMDGKTESGQFSFNNVVLNQVEDGVAASFSLDGMELTSDEAINGNFGAVSAANLDIGGMLG
ncbi:MAG TPA: hypothetical protein VL133_13720, partial [Devosia sp.]|nr:hypothetical protein [Devosia sp.]